MKECTFCGREVAKFTRKRKGEGYCATCFAYLFKNLKCSCCGELKRIYKHDEVPICQTCEIERTACIRCGKVGYKVGKITEDGPVCNSCSVYYRLRPSCSICNKNVRNVSRRLAFNITDPICTPCFNKMVGVKCSRCHQVYPPFFYTLEKKPVCKDCATKPDIACNECGKLKPAGSRKKMCRVCASKKRLYKRLAFSKVALNPVVSDVFVQYGIWMEETRHPEIAARKIISSFEVFQFLSDWYDRYGKLPSYDEYACNLTVAKTRQHLTVTYFLDYAKLIPLNHQRKLEIGNIDCIDRAYDRLPKNSPLFKYMDSYHKLVIKKYHSGKNTALSARLAFGAAVNMLLLGERQGKSIPDVELAQQYLWLHIGQKASLWAFITHLRDHYCLELDLFNKRNDVFELARPKETRERSKQKLIAMLRSDSFSFESYVEVALAYYHRVEIPVVLRGIKSELKIVNGEWFNIKMGSKTFKIPFLLLIEM